MDAALGTTAHDIATGQLMAESVTKEFNYYLATTEKKMAKVVRAATKFIYENKS